MTPLPIEAQYDWGACPECGAPPKHDGDAVVMLHSPPGEPPEPAMMHPIAEDLMRREGACGVTIRHGWHHWVVCDRCRVRWEIGSGLFSLPQRLAEEDPAYTEQAQAECAAYRVVTESEPPARPHPEAEPTA